MMTLTVLIIVVLLVVVMLMTTMLVFWSCSANTAATGEDAAHYDYDDTYADTDADAAHGGAAAAADW